MNHETPTPPVSPTPMRSIGCCGDGHEHGEEAGFYVRNRELLFSLAAGAFLVGTFLGERLGLPKGPAIAFYLVAYGFGGAELAGNWIRSALRGKPSFDIDLLMLLAAAGAAALGDWAEGAFLLFLFSLAHALEHMATGRARNAIRALADLTPDVALVRRAGGESEVPIEEVLPGDVVIVKPGARIPVDGSVLEGRSSVDQAPITGESVPVEKAPGDATFAGTINGSGALAIVSERAVGDRTLDRVVRLVEEAQAQKAPTEQFSDRFSAILVPAVLIADVLLIVAPPLLGWLTWGESFYRGMALLVAASPCALAIGTPATVLAGIAQAARNGVLVKGGAHLENLGNVRAIAFDKTGTLTVGRPEVTDVIPLDASEAELLEVAAAVERRSGHPLAQAVVRRAEGLPSGEAEDLQNVPGKGVRATLNGETVEVGSPRLFKSLPPAVVEAVGRAEGRSVILVRLAGRWLGVLGVADAPRPAAKPTLEALRRLGVKPLIMLTGDGRAVAEVIARDLPLDEIYADLLPEDKAGLIRELLAKHGSVAMIGDGVNDAPALAHATVGIAMGGAGTAVALETADVALMGDDLSRLPYAVALARRASRTIRVNLFIALGVIMMLVVTTIFGFMRIGPAVVFHEGSTLVVLANSLRLLRFRR